MGKWHPQSPEGYVFEIGGGKVSRKQGSGLLGSFAKRPGRQLWGLDNFLDF